VLLSKKIVIGELFEV